MNPKKNKRKKKIGLLSDSHVKVVNDLIRNIYPDFSAEGYELWIDGIGAQHIEQRHGKNGEADSTMASREEKALIPWAAQNAETGDFIREPDGSVRHSRRFFNSDGSRAPEIRLEKKTSEGLVFISECVPDSVNKRIWITSAYRNKNGSKGQLLNIEDSSSPQPTPEASFDSNATNNSIPQNQKNVKGIDENSSDKQFALPLDEDGEEKISGAEVMSWLKSKPESDGKIDLEATVARGLPYRRGKSNLTVGELRKVIANSTHEKVYSKKDALRVVNKFSGSSGLTVKAREEIADTIWQLQ